MVFSDLFAVAFSPLIPWEEGLVNNTPHGLVFSFRHSSPLVPTLQPAN